MTDHACSFLISLTETVKHKIKEPQMRQKREPKSCQPNHKNPLHKLYKQQNREEKMFALTQQQSLQKVN